MHGEFLTFPKGDDEEAARMSKSSGEFLTLDSLIGRGYDPLTYRYFLLTAHYRQQLAFSWAALDAAASAFKSLKRAVLDLRAGYTGDDKPIEKLLREFRQAVEDDLNMPRALAAMWATAKDPSAAKGEIYATLLAMDNVLGFGFEKMEEEKLGISKEEIEKRIGERTAARKAGEYNRADQIRDDLAGRGIEISDTNDGTVWRAGRPPIKK
jgi:cysteinyl-tRNA synthetase